MDLVVPAACRTMGQALVRVTSDPQYLARAPRASCIAPDVE